MNLRWINKYDKASEYSLEDLGLLASVGVLHHYPANLGWTKQMIMKAVAS